MKIDKLIEKYFNGETSPEEEKKLREMLKEDKSGKYEELKFMLKGFDGLRKVSSDFDALPFKIQAEETKNNDRKSKVLRLKISYLVAAAVIIIVSVIAVNLFRTSNKGIVINDSNVAQNADFTKKEMADVFLLVSDKVDYAMNSADAFDEISKQLDVLEKLDIINKYTTNER